ncbi:alpha/beta hydrolase [Serinibacter salmoneus]|uniref:Alpha-beta hydrolase superfamily lysophospholipase n=1 Tax=Serinibacter salmoneus TaxID=556530 RepID=A0A2A9CX69_9MICO|nr:alpha/beta hydrolase [Serinibacter salmoneus]PFG18736.1 alpha-beta hydrolase superfamily lysophospholipase [Serinibacter salmoneus]
MTQWHEDVLGAPYQARTLAVTPDDPGAAESDPPVATLVRHGAPRHRAAVLYVHGFSDYFLQAHLGRAFDSAGLDLYAVDLRRYGRSRRGDQMYGMVRDLAVYDEEISAAIQVARAEGHERVVLLGHSTGGLISTLFAADHPDLVDLLVLNSPWYDINDRAALRLLSGPVVAAVNSRDATRVVSRLGSDYTRSIHSDFGGPWDFSLEWKPPAGYPVRAGFVHAVRRGQRRVHRGLDLPMPVLMCTSSRSSAPGRRPTPEDLRGSDTVLNVRHMWREVPGLGRDVTLRTVPGGIHDLALSAAGPRTDYLDAVTTWTSQRLAAFEADAASRSTSADPALD